MADKTPAKHSLAVFRFPDGQTQTIEYHDNDEGFRQQALELGERGGKLLGRIDLTYAGGDSFATALYPRSVELEAVARDLAAKMAAGDLMAEGEGSGKIQ